MYILSISPKAFIRQGQDISPKAFIRQGQDGEIIIVSNPNRATTFDKIGDAMRIAAQVNEDLETNKVHVFSLQ